MDLDEDDYVEDDILDDLREFELKLKEFYVFFCKMG
jgi:hypothetical protein